MSCTTVYAAFEDGDMTELGECWNSHRGAMWIWRALADKYLGGYRFGAENAVWKLADDPRLTDGEHYALVSTFDFVLVPPDLMIAVADSLEGFEPGTENLQRQAELIRDAHTRGARGIGWLQTSVCQSPWWWCEDDDDDGRAWNLDRDERIPGEGKRTAWWMVARSAPSADAWRKLDPDMRQDYLLWLRNTVKGATGSSSETKLMHAAAADALESLFPNR